MLLFLFYAQIDCPLINKKLVFIKIDIECCSQQARLAQLVERKALNLVVVGSSPTVGVSIPF